MRAVYGLEHSATAANSNTTNTNSNSTSKAKQAYGGMVKLAESTNFNDEMMPTNTTQMLRSSTAAHTREKQHFLTENDRRPMSHSVANNHNNCNINVHSAASSPITQIENENFVNISHQSSPAVRKIKKSNNSSLLKASLEPKQNSTNASSTIYTMSHTNDQSNISFRTTNPCPNYEYNDVSSNILSDSGSVNSVDFQFLEPTNPKKKTIHHDSPVSCKPNTLKKIDSRSDLKSIRIRTEDNDKSDTKTDNTAASEPHKPQRKNPNSSSSSNLKNNQMSRSNSFVSVDVQDSDEMEISFDEKMDNLISRESVELNIIRPQSRKLYLGTELTISTVKVPRSAGARYSNISSPTALVEESGYETISPVETPKSCKKFLTS
jgi:hypothetical protein